MKSHKICFCTSDVVYSFYRRMRNNLAVELKNRVKVDVLFAAMMLSWETLTTEQKAELLDKAKKVSSYE